MQSSDKNPFAKKLQKGNFQSRWPYVFALTWILILNSSCSANLGIYYLEWSRYNRIIQFLYFFFVNYRKQWKLNDFDA